MSQAKEWAISIESRSETENFRVTVVLKGQTDQEICQFECKLPPDLPALFAASDSGADFLRGLPTRELPAGLKGLDELPSDKVYFHAGDRKTLSTIGDRLFDSLFRDPDGDDHAEVLISEIAHARERGDFLKVTLNLADAPELVGVPWEAAFYKRGGYFLATDVAANLVRVLPDGPPNAPPPIVGPVKVLIVIANPFPERPLDMNKEREQITKILGAVPATAAGAAAFEVLPPLVDATRAMLRRAMADLNPHVVHFIGHGAFRDQSGFIALQGDEPGTADLVDADAWRLFFQNDKPWLAFLNSCQGAQAEQGNLFGGTAQGLIQAGVPFVVAMQFPISDPAAILFAEEFYRALAKGDPVVQAVSRGRNAIAGNDACAPELITPVVYSSGVAEVLPLAAPIAVAPEDEPPPPTPDPWRKIAVGALGVLAIAVAALIAAQWRGGTESEEATNASEQMPAGAAPDDGDQESADDRDPRDRGPTASMSGPPAEAFPDEIGLSPGAGAPRTVPRKVIVKRRTTATRTPATAGEPGGGGYGFEVVPPAPPPPLPPPPPPPAPPPPPPPPAPVPVVIGGSGCMQGVVVNGELICSDEIITTSSRRRERGLFGTLGHALGKLFGGIFGGAKPMPEPVAAPPPPPPLPPPPPPMVQPVCNKGPYIVFFDWDKSDITPEAANILDNAIGAYGNCASVPITLAGHTDRSGPARYNLGLAQRRNGSVRDYLSSHGVPDADIAAQAFGESQLRVPTADGVRELQNRRVEVTYGPGSGM